MWDAREGTSTDTERRLGLPGAGRWGWGVSADKHEVSLGGDGNVPKLFLMVAQFCKYTKIIK